jgi:hypothetical protein
MRANSAVCRTRLGAAPPRSASTKHGDASGLPKSGNGGSFILGKAVIWRMSANRKRNSRFSSKIGRRTK